MDGRSPLLLFLFLFSSSIAIRCYRTNDMFISEDIHRPLKVSIEHSNLIIDKCALIVYFLDIAKCRFVMMMKIYAGEEIKGYFNMDELKEMQRAEEKKKLKEKKMKMNATETTLEMNTTTRRMVENGTSTTAATGGNQRRRRSAAAEALGNNTLTTDGPVTDSLTNSEQQNGTEMTTRSSQTSSERPENNSTSGTLETTVSMNTSVEMNTSTTSQLEVTSTSIQNITAETTTKDSSVETTTKDAIEKHYRNKLLEEIELCLTAVGIFGSANEGPEACIQEAKDRIKKEKDRARLFARISAHCSKVHPIFLEFCLRTAELAVKQMLDEKTATRTLETTPADDQKLGEAETTVEPIKDDGSPEIEGELSPDLPVVFVCEEDLCNENLRFTEERMGNELDMDKYRCIEEFKDAFWDQYKKEIMELTGKNETELDEDEELDVNTTSRASTTEYVPPRKDVPKPISSDLIFGIVLVVLLVGHCVHCVYKMKTNRKKDDHIP